MSGGLAEPLGSGSGRWSFWGRLTVGVGLIGLLLIVVDPVDVVRVGRRAHPGWAAAVIALSVAWLTLGAFNVWILLRRLAPVAFRDFLRVYLTSWAAALVIPGQLGDATQVMLLRRYDVPMSHSGAAYLADKVISLSWMMVVAAVGVALYLPRFHGWWLVAPPLLVFAALWLTHRLFESSQVSESSWLGRGRRGLSTVRRQVKSLRSFPGTLFANVTLTGVKWLAMACLYLWSFRAFGTSVDFIAAATIPVISSLVGYLPVTVGGAGTMEWTAVALFGGLGIEAAPVVAAYLFLRAILLIGALAAWLAIGRTPFAEVGPSRS